MRELDILDVAEGSAGLVLAKRLEEIERDPEDVVALYLAARQEGRAGAARFQQAVDVDPTYAWAHHGLAWSLHFDGRTKRALGVQERAIELSATPMERAMFVETMVRYLADLDRDDEARELLEETLLAQDLEAVDRIELEVELAVLDLDSVEPIVGRGGLERALELVAEEDLTGRELFRLVTASRRFARFDDGTSGALVDGLFEVALGARPGPERTNVLAGLVGRSSNDVLLAGMVIELDDAPIGDRVRAHLVRGQEAKAIEVWLGAQPKAVLDDEGRPSRPALAALVEAARAEPFEPEEFAHALLEAGWYAEAHAWSGALSIHDLALAKRLRDEATRELALIEGLAHVLESIDRGVEYTGPFMDARTPPHELTSLDDLLDVTEALFVMAGEVQPELQESPRESHGPFAEIVIPGPEFSDSDEARGLGTSGEAIPGLARMLNRRGRFGIFGKAMGQGGPDASVLKLLEIEHRSGKHLGVPFHGQCAWCDGADLVSRPERRGARIGGAALHEGWWIDVAAGRRTLARWRRLEARLKSSAGSRLESQLSSRGPKLESYPGAKPTKLVATDGLGDRLRLALLVERDASGDDSASSDDPLVTLDDVLEVTAIHEEGHLCDRTRFLPLGRHLGRVMKLLWQAGGQPARLAELLEYRAQLTAVASCPEPRMALAQCLDRLANPSRLTPHDAGYGKLVEEFLEVLDRERSKFDVLDDEHFLVHQLHLLSADDVRRVARLVAEREGMLEEEL